MTVSVCDSLAAPELMPRRLTVCTGILVDGQVGQRIERRRLVDRVDGDGEGAGDDVVAGAAVIDGDGDGGRARAIGDRGEGDGTGGVGAGVIDRGIIPGLGLGNSVKTAPSGTLPGVVVTWTMNSESASSTTWPL